MTPRPRRAQASLETVVALALFAIAALGAWTLYGPQLARSVRPDSPAAR